MLGVRHLRPRLPGKVSKRLGSGSTSLQPEFVILPVSRGMCPSVPVYRNINSSLSEQVWLQGKPERK